MHKEWQIPRGYFAMLKNWRVEAGNRDKDRRMTLHCKTMRRGRGHQYHHMLCSQAVLRQMKLSEPLYPQMFIKNIIFTYASQQGLLAASVLPPERRAV